MLILASPIILSVIYEGQMTMLQQSAPATTEMDILVSALPQYAAPSTSFVK
jgi:hypothetical protein